jgi:6-phosphogluconolactonase (cycloisomerase 2 family)
VVSNRPDAAVDAPLPISVSVSPPTANLEVRGTQAFTAQVTNSDAGVTWSVNGVAGGNATVGTISADGMYTAPARRPRPVDVMITATSVGDTSKSANATATISSQGVAYVLGTNSRVDIFENVRTRNGDIAPSRSLVGAATQLQYNIGAAIDVVRDRLYVGNFGGQSVTSYAGIDTVTGDVAPTAKLTSSPAFTSIENVDLDPQRNLLYVSGQAADILVFDATQPLDGTLTPLRAFKESTITFNADRRTFLDVANDRLYQTQASGGKVFVFENASTANGTITNTRVITGTQTTLASPWGITLDDKRDLLYVSDYSTNNIKVFAMGNTVTGDVAPVRIITLTGAGMYPEDISIDPETDTLAVQMEGTGRGIYFLDAASTLDGMQTPTRSIAGAATMVTNPQGLIMDWDR